MPGLKDPTKVTVGEHDYYIHPFSAFKAANVSGDVMKLISPFLSSFMQGDNLSDMMGIDMGVLMDGIGKCFENVDGNEFERILRKLLTDSGNIGVNYRGESTTLTENILDEWTSESTEDLYILAFHVIRVNYKGFFKRLGNLSGKATDEPQTTETTEITA